MAMKNAIKLAALLICTSIFAAAQSKFTSKNALSINEVSFDSPPSGAGAEVKVVKHLRVIAIVLIYDEYANVFLKEILSTDNGIDNDYILNKPDNGEYIIEVTS